MWCGIGNKTVSIATICFVTASVVVSDVGFAARRRDYTPQQFRTLLRGLGYKVKVTNAPLKDKETVEAIREFQRGYRLKPADGILGAKTQDFAASIMQILQANLNLLVKPNPPLPRDQYFGPRTEAAIKQYQRKLKLQETGIADLALRQRIDEEARKLLKNPASTEETTPTPKPSPTIKPRTRPQATPKPKPGATPKPTPTATPTESPTPEESPSPSPESTPETTPSPSPESTPETTPSPSPESTPETTPSPEATPSPSPTGTPKPTPTPRR
jgi:peptidoglycan hydrolase-like protein with peptidoglycan-binding domain